MKNNSLFGVILGVIIVVGVIAGLIWYQNDRSENQITGGSLYIGITDETANIENVNEISLEVEKVEIHSSTRGWVTVSSDSKSYNLLALKASGKTELYAREQVDAETYNRVRVTLGDAVVKTKNNGDVKAYMPGRQVVMNMVVNVTTEADTHVELDVLADRSLHITSDNQYVFTPVINAGSRSNTSVAVASDNSITATGGTMDSNISVGLDIDGSSRMNFVLDSTNDLRVDASNNSDIKFMLGGNTYMGNKNTQDEPKTGERNSNVDSSIDVELNGALDVSL